MLTNPGTIIGGGIGAKGAQLGKGAMDYLIAMDMARYAGINFTPVEKLFEVNRWNRLRNPKYVTEQDKRILSEHLPEYKLIQEKALDEGTYM